MNSRQTVSNLLLAICWSLMAAILMPAVYAQHGSRAKPSPSPTPMVPPFNVTSTVNDFDDLGGLLLMRSDDSGASGQATYKTISARKGAGNLVSSTINAAGEWELALSDQSGRSLWVTPNQAIDSSQPAAPPADFYAVQKAYANCRDQAGNTVAFPSLTNGSGNCSMAVNFFYGGILYKLLMRPGALEGTTCPSVGCPVTGLAKVTCNIVAQNQCVDWTITPNADAALIGVSNLYSYTGPRGAEWVFIGQYYNTFRVHATNP